MTTDIKKAVPPPVPPRHNKEYYEEDEKIIKNSIIKKGMTKDSAPPVAPRRISSRVNSIYGKDSINMEKNYSSKNLLNNKEFDDNILGKEIMSELNNSSDLYKLSEDKLTLYEEDGEDKKTERDENVLKSLSSLTINNENNVRERMIEEVPSDSDSFKSISDSSNSSSQVNTNKPLPLISEAKKESLESKEKEHKKSKSSKIKTGKSKSKSKSKDEKKKSKKSKEEKRKSKRKSAYTQPIINITHENEEEVKSLREREKVQRELIIREQEKLGELTQKQYLIMQHQYNLSVSQKKQYNILIQNNSLEQLAIFQQQQERQNASIQQNQNELTQKVAAQQQIIASAVDIHTNIVKRLISYTGESPEVYAIPPPPVNLQPFPVSNSSSDNISSTRSNNRSNRNSLNVGSFSVNSNGNSAPSSPNLGVNILPNGRKVSSPVMSPIMSPALSPVVDNSYYDEGVYSVSGFSIASSVSENVSEDIESVSILTDQIQQSVMRRPTFQKSNLSFNQKIRIGGSDPNTFQTTLNAYRLNVKNASDPALQFEYAKFLIEAANDQYENGSTDSSVKHKNDLFDEGFKFLKKLSNAGYPDAQHYLATCYKQDDDWDKAYPLFLQAAKHNHPISSYEIASYYESKKNYKKASQYYKKSASQGYPLAMHRLGTAALRGEMHMRKDVKNAVKWLKRAAVVATKENNGAASAYELALLYGDGMPPLVYPDEMYALELLVQAAELDYPPAQYKLGWCFEYGELGCPTDAVQSIHWFLLAAENNEPNAQFSLAGWYLTGAEGVIEPNDKEAFHWASKAAEQKYVKAEYAIAYFYEMGIGIEKNMEEAMRWYGIAAEHGDERAIKRLENESSDVIEKSSNSDCKIA
jgi:TPR repeat protein